MLKINDIPAYVIHVRDAKERFDNIQTQINKKILKEINIFYAYTPDNIINKNPEYYNYFYKRFDDSYYNRRTCCLTLSHLDIIKKAQELKLPYVIIFEDDFNLKESFKINYILNHQFDFLYIGGYFTGENIIKGLAENIYSVNAASCSVAYILCENIYSFIIEQIYEKYENKIGLLGIDGFYSNIIHSQIETKAIIPTLVNTIPSKSLLTDTPSDHLEYYKKIDGVLNTE